MGYGGRLIRPGLADIRRYVSTPPVPEDPPDPAVPGVTFDEDFREASTGAPEDGEQVGESTWTEKEALMLPCQIEVDQHEKQNVVVQGDSPLSLVTLVLHFRYLLRAGLVDTETGLPSLNRNDRLAGLYDSRRRLLRLIPESPGLWLREVRPYGPGVGGSRNLCLALFESTDLGIKG